MLSKIDNKKGQLLMRAWGINDWPDVEADYQLWSDCGCFAVIDKGDHVELHMAMRKENRRQCREAVREILRYIGNKYVIAKIAKKTSQSVINCAIKCGFSHYGDFTMKTTTGEILETVCMIKR